MGVRLTGPDGVEVEKQGSAPLRLRYEVTGAERLGSWRVTVTNAGRMTRLSGQVRVDFTRASREAAKPAAAGPVTDGKVTYPQEKHRIRAACRDRNQDVSVRVDLERGTGGLFLSYVRVAALEPRETSAGVVELTGSGGETLFLDTGRRVLFFRGGRVFCKVRVYYGEG